MTFAFYLKEPQKELTAAKQKATPLVLVVSHNNRKFKKQIGISVRPADFKKQRTRNEAQNDMLRKIENHLNDILGRYSTEDEIRKAMADAIHISQGAPAIEPPQKKKEGGGAKIPSFWDYFDEWAERPTTTIRQRKNIKNLIAKTMGRKDDWQHIDTAYYFRLITKLKSAEYSVNYIGSVVAKLKTVMSEGYKMKYHRNTDYHLFSKMAERPDTVYLTEEELEKLWNLELHDSMSHKARDLFLLGCYTAMRFSDYSRISEDCIIDGTIRLTQRKTSDSVIIPAGKRVRAILERNGGKAPAMCQVVFNRAIKEVCKKADIATIVEVTKSKGNHHVTERKPKYTQVSSHTARRTGATLLFQTGISLQSLMLITGHKSPQALLSYLRLGKEENAAQLKGNPFFK